MKEKLGINMPSELPLREIHLPAMISGVSLQIGWWILFGALILVVLLFLLLIKKFKQPKLKKEAAKKLEAIKKAFEETEDAKKCVSEISIFLRRAVLSKNELKSLGGLTGTAWLEILDKQLKKPEFSQGIGKILIAGPYCPKVEKDDAIKLMELCNVWVKAL